MEAGSLFFLWNVNKIVFPASLEFISEDVFAMPDGNYKDAYLDLDTVYVAPKGSYAESFLKDYKPVSEEVRKLSVESI